MQAPSLQMPPTTRLTDEQFDQLSDFLDETSGAIVDVEMLDGFFAALVCSPEPVHPSEFMPMILGDDFSFASQDEAMEIMGLLMHHWNFVAHSLREASANDEPYGLLLVERVDMDDDADEKTHAAMQDLGVDFDDDEDDLNFGPGAPWSFGFVIGASMRGNAWEPMLLDEEHSFPMMAITLLAKEIDEGSDEGDEDDEDGEDGDVPARHDADDHADQEPEEQSMTPEQREQIFEALGDFAIEIYRYFEPARSAQVSSQAGGTDGVTMH